MKGLFMKPMSSYFKLVSIFLTAALTLTVHAGGGSDGGTNMIGNELLDDYDVKGSQEISQEELETLAAPILKPLADRLPEFANWIKEGFAVKKWYREPKAFDPKKCRDESLIQTVHSIPACQSKFTVRIQKSYIDRKPVPAKLADVIVHELLVEKYGTPDEGLFAISRAVRDPKLSPQELASAIRSIRPDWEPGRIKAVYDYEENLFSETMKNVSILICGDGKDSALRKMVERQMNELVKTSYAGFYRYDPDLHVYGRNAQYYYSYVSAVDNGDIEYATRSRVAFIEQRGCPALTGMEKLSPVSNLNSKPTESGAETVVGFEPEGSISESAK